MAGGRSGRRGFLCVAALAVAIASGCGGQTRTSPSSGGAGGTAGSPSGGSPASSGGSGAGGSGGSSGAPGGGSGGVAGAPGGSGGVAGASSCAPCVSGRYSNTTPDRQCCDHEGAVCDVGWRGATCQGDSCMAMQCTCTNHVWRCVPQGLGCSSYCLDVFADAGP